MPRPRLSPDRSDFAGLANNPALHPLPSEQVFLSPGCHFSYRVIGPCCRLFDREQLPWPCCRLQWRGKEPSWRRIGKRLVADLATKGHPSYAVEIVGQRSPEPLIVTLYSVKLPQPINDWWFSDKPRRPVDPEVERVLSGVHSSAQSSPGASVPNPSEATIACTIGSSTHGAAEETSVEG